MDIAQVLTAYRTFDPAAWVSVYRMMPTWVGLVCVAVGITFLLFGSGRNFRFVAGPTVAFVGFLWVPLIAQRFGVPLAPHVLSISGAVLLGALGVAFPPAAVFFGFGLPAGYIAGNLAGPNDWMLGFAPGLLAVGTMAAVFARIIGAVLASLVGAWLLVLGMLAALHTVGGVVAAVASQPWGVLLAAALFAFAGAVYQIFVRPSPEEAERLRIESAKSKRKLTEQRALEKRWSTLPSDDE
ncbi:MAG: hypothetical protein WBV82_31690 [Myxococcaceae bacterium]